MSHTPNADAAAHARALPKAAVPEAARGPEIPESGYLVEEIGDDLFWLADGVFQMMFAVTDEGVIAVDAPPSLGHNILRAIRGVTTKPVTGLALYGGYWDAVAAAAADDVAQRWVDRLGGADVFTLPNAWAMAQTLRIDDSFTGPFGITP
jgi:hypothetical protein